MAAAALLPFLLLAPPPQGPDEVLATFVLAGEPAAVTRTDVALEMAHNLRRQERGRQAADQLVAAVLTRRIATERGLLPTRDEAKAFWTELQQQLRAAGRRPEDFAAVRNTTEAQWLDDIAVQLAQERIVRAELELSAKEAVTGDMLSLWLQEQRKRTAVVTDPDALPPGTAVRVGTTDVPLIDLGTLLLRTAEDGERDEFVRKLAYLAVLEAEARREGLEVTAADLDASVERRRRDAARDPRYQGVSFENMLEAQGFTTASLRELRTFRAQILLDKLAARRFPAAALAQELDRDRQGVLDRVGPRRRLGLVFVRAIAQPNALVPRDFDAARAHLDAVRARLATEPFDAVARAESEHSASTAQGGDTGWHGRRSERLPEPVLAAAFALEPGAVSAPVRTDDGWCLVKVLEVEPMPGDAQLLERLREANAHELQQQLLAGAKIELARRDAAGK